MSCKRIIEISFLCFCCAKVPKDYLELIKVLQAEVQQCRKDERWPVLSADEFWNLFSSLQNNNIRSKEEMELGEKAPLSKMEGTTVEMTDILSSIETPQSHDSFIHLFWIFL